MGQSKKSWAVVVPEDFDCQENLEDLNLLEKSSDKSMLKHMLDKAYVKLSLIHI